MSNLGLKLLNRNRLVVRQFNLKLESCGAANLSTYSNRSLLFGLSLDNKNRRRRENDHFNKRFVSVHSVKQFHKQSALLNTNIDKMNVEQVSVPVPWGSIKLQIFGDRQSAENKPKMPIVCLHGFLDNSNSFLPMAPHLCKSGEYYLISVDLPGHGFSSKLPDGISYSSKIMLTSVRQVIRHLNLEKFYFVVHSYGNIISFMYQTIFKNEVIANVSLDWITSYTPEKWARLDEILKEGIDKTLDDQINERQNQKEYKKELTKEAAIEILLKANNHLDRESAKILIERAVVVNDFGKLQFSRDIRLRFSKLYTDHYIDAAFLMPMTIQSLTAPQLVIRADPPSYGEWSSKNTSKILDEMKTNSKAHFEILNYKGTHHFHMIDARETASLILDFLGKYKITQTSKL